MNIVELYKGWRIEASSAALVDSVRARVDEVDEIMKRYPDNPSVTLPVEGIGGQRGQAKLERNARGDWGNR